MRGEVLKRVAQSLKSLIAIPSMYVADILNLKFGYSDNVVDFFCFSANSCRTERLSNDRSDGFAFSGLEQPKRYDLIEVRLRR